MSMDADLKGMNDVQQGIDNKKNGAVVAIAQGGREHAEYLLQRIRNTAPVDSGEYKNDWRIEDDRGGDDEIHIVNSVPYGAYLVFPNQRMIGSIKADDPSRGIIHNVRGLVHSEQTGFKTAIIRAIRRVLF